MDQRDFNDLDFNRADFCIATNQTKAFALTVNLRLRWCQRRILGGALGWVAGIGALAIPGLGPFIAAGPIMAAFSGAAIAGAAGGTTGGLIGLSFCEYEAKLYERHIRDGNALIST